MIHSFGYHAHMSDKGLTVRKMISISASMAAEIESMRWERKITSESEVFRQLLEKGLRADKIERQAISERERGAG